MSDLENEAGEIEVRRSSRRQVVSNKKADRFKALAAMKEARRIGTVHRPNVDDLIKDVYDNVDEDEYNEIVRNRQRDDFVVDDDGSGYVDNGIDFFEEDEEEEHVERKKKEKKKEEKKKGALTSFFRTTATVKQRVEDENKVKIDEDDDLKDILKGIGEPLEEEEYVEEEPAELVSKNPFKRDTQKRQASPDIAPRPVKTARLQQLIKPRRTSKIDVSTFKTPKEEVSESSSSSSKPKEEIDNQQFAADDFDDDFNTEMDIHEEIVPDTRLDEPVTNVKKELSKSPEPAKATARSNKLEIKEEHMFAETEWIKQESEKSLDVEVKSGEEAFYIKDENGQPAVRMYWIDAFEDAQKHAGTVYLFGRVQFAKGSYESCCVVVKNIQREIFFIPRTTSVLVDGSATNNPVPMTDVYDEVKTVLNDKFFIANFKCRKAKRRLMNCENEGEPSEDVDVLEVQYESAHPKIPADTSGSTFRCIANTTSTAMERLLVEKEMMGPGWIDIYNFVEATAKVSFCKYEFTVDMEKMKNLNYIKNQAQMAIPPVRMLALNVITTLNEKKENEICIISCLYNPRCDMNQPTTERRNLQRLCFVSTPTGGALPFDIKNCIRSKGLDGIVLTAVNEKVLLNMFLAKMQTLEPDIFLGHDISFQITSILGRLEKHKIPNWSRISRLRRSATINKVGHSKAAQWEMTAGRLLVDSKTSAMELVKSRSYELEDLVQTILKEKIQSIYSNEVLAKFSNSSALMNLINWSFDDPLYSLRIVAQINALPLALQITNIVGGIASRTLMGGRAERNEFLLLHAFHKVNIIPPNKYQPVFNFNKKDNKKKVKSEEADHDATGEEKSAENDNEGEGRKKAQYLGGLVLEPKKGLYDTLILLLDFNSLYPSIIQEYNICFSTINYTNKDGDDLPDVPGNDLPEGILPKEIRGLVERRRQVKNLMKNARSEIEKKQYDIRQMGLKLTANSMYGCLGFQQSRFYAKPLAALVTSKGREILMHTKELVEKLGYTVVYGDTDSIMINTNSNDLKQAKKLGFEIKKQVNQCHKLLELDLDGVFKRMLLLKKKKYAALTVNVDDENDLNKELKGLDIVRRDWSLLAKTQGTTIVDLILDPSKSREELVADIHESLSNLRAELDSGKVEIEQFEILKQLTRDPKDYADAKSQPHVSVALRLNNSGKFHLKQGDIVKYIVCEDGSGNSAVQRAYHQSEVKANDMKVDLHYYLAQQVHPVVSRLCAPIEETDAVRIAEALGMDASSYRRSAAAMAANAQSTEDELVWKELESFDHCEPFTITCPYEDCKAKIEMKSLFEIEGQNLICSLEKCRSCSKSLVPYGCYLSNNMMKQLSDFVEKQSKTSFVCDDQVCAYRTRVHTMKWSREGVECPKCSGGVMRKEYSEKDLFEQQSFFKKIVDFKKATEELPAEFKKISNQNNSLHEVSEMCNEYLLPICERFLEKNAYTKVDLAFLFAPMCRV